ncbi:MAG TPA: hypothetical protein VJ967_03755, partial [Clostridia bacterium]|nr:hypothetical protein [Clostridia bacterium]
QIRIADTVDVQGSYACFQCGFAQRCKVAGVWDIFPQDTEILPQTIPGITNQDPHLPKQERRSDLHLRLEEAAKRLISEVGYT